MYRTINQTTMNGTFAEILDLSARHKKFLPIGYLTATYSVEELNEMEQTANGIMQSLQSAQQIKMEKELLGITAFYTFQYIKYLEIQIPFIRRAKKHLNGIHEVQFASMENKIEIFDLCSN